MSKPSQSAPPLSRRLLPALAALALAVAAPDASAASAVYGGGPFYSGGTAVMDDLRASGFTTIILWSFHIEDNGDLVYNDIPVVRNGAYMGDAAWPTRLATLKTAPTSVNRIEVSIGAWSVPDFERMARLVNGTAAGCGTTLVCGTGSNSILYRNFQALKAATGADAVNFDDESAYALAPTTTFGQMLIGQGYKITFAPYTQQTFWRSLKDNLGSAVDRIYLQVYDGGAGNNPASWNTAMGMTVDPGLWSRHGTGCTSGDSPASVQSRMSGWKTSAGIRGGFMWLYDDIQRCSAQGTSAQYAAAINTAVSGNTPPVANFGVTVSSLTATFSDSSTDADGTITSRSWNFGDGGTSTATNPSRTYASAGNYNVTLTVTDNGGASNTKSQTVSVGAGVANLALNKPTTSSAACNSNESAAKAVNGSVSGGTTDKFCSLVSPAWMQVDLGSAQTVSSFTLKHAGAGGENTSWNTQAFTIQTSSNGTTWSTPVTVSTNTASSSTHAITSTSARYIKLNVTTPTQNGDPATRIYEFEVR
ncbi:discoidin domain-containing protein [Myxococcus sp. CA051A]|uniref:PKD domain-containing protein n=1 Tax=Myxococcus llanfairpwllgwyngyllgogerychwyrndrobwllllantysiliogogogochensis TaxID=2590453 RepID=A0A540X9K3_9BACT|nr:MULTISPECIES: PKD domain-containing protein [Myxococcus]NTX04447.1 discoidin domain-containing protein [Myxococcus sp. CA040A]NTX17019.1 discoidin domain-containing protein [Myxococcus sp. CA056]NTX35804.1 discoidin domain-containing protein [Myxococcus sp. CA033]NTX63533.1 discoidin domain-containing protein [Myxococcus sp. CA051A]TQF17971.1 PKD domain-containing protein [Myxococcus llanfairpwllgwyngyllgogerychwyrndrobwllllantysiliogogogochensis]